jgi:hypothetical protein
MRVRQLDVCRLTEGAHHVQPKTGRDLSGYPGLSKLLFDPDLDMISVRSDKPCVRMIELLSPWV